MERLENKLVEGKNIVLNTRQGSNIRKNVLKYLILINEVELLTFQV